MTTTDLSSAKILVIDDDLVIGDLVARIFQDSNLGVVHCITDPREAEARFLEIKPDLVLLDLRMPHMDGLQVLKALRACEDTDLRAPILMITSESRTDLRHEALCNGATDFLVKPFDSIEIALRASNLLETRFLHRQLAARRDESLHKEREFLSAILDNAQVGVVACDAHGVLTLFNRYTRELHGLPEEPLPAEAWAEHYDLYLPDGKTRMRTEDIPLFRALQGEQVRDVEVVIAPRHGGSKRILRTSGQAIVDSHGKTLGAAVVMHDITERRKAAEKIRKSEERLAEAQRLAHIGSWEWNVRSGEVLWSDEEYRLYGYAPEEIQPSYDFWLVCVHPDDRELAAARIREVLTTKKATKFDHRIVRPDGQERIINSRAAVVLADSGDVVRLVGTAQDITEQRRAEEAVRRATEELESQVLDRTSELRTSNQQLSLEIQERNHAQKELQLRITQAAAVAELGQQALLQRALPEFFETVVILTAKTLGVEYCKILELQANGQSLLLRAGVGWKEGQVGHATVGAGQDSQAGYTLRSKHPVIVDDLRTEKRFSGPAFLHEYDVVSGISVRIGTQDQPYGVLGAHTAKERHFSEDDVHFLESIANLLAAMVERTSIENSLNAARLEAESANFAKSEFLSRMSHELRTPLNGILGFGQVLEMNALEGQPGACVTQILKAGRHLLSLINEILDISGIEAGRVSFSIEPVRVIDAAREALDLVRPLADQRNLRIEMPEENPLETWVCADRQRLKQVLLNLLANAVKYNREGGCVTLSWEENPSERLRISVRDTGRGIAPESMPRLFTPFDRLGADRTEVEGSGLGLALSKRLIKAMGGEIGAESVVGTGSTFWIKLPKSSSPLARVHEAGLPPDSAATSLQGTILYIEDNLANLNLVEYLFSQHPQIKLLAAMQGWLGTELAREHQPDLILLDLHLPDMMGDEVLACLKGDPATRHIPVVMLTADATPTQETRLRAAGADDYLTKPIDVPRLLRLIEKTLARSAENHGNTRGKAK